MSTITISIGRNVGGTPMSSVEWASFQRGVTTVIKPVASEVYFYGTGSGTWDGSGEESATWVFAASAWDVEAWHFTASLRLLATMFGQEAIALTIGQTEMIVGMG